MRTDLEVIIDGINEVLACPPALRPDGCGYGEWEKERHACLAVLFQKLEAAPFYAITATYAQDPEDKKCDTAEQL